jgi:hypothetical protein
MLLSLTVNSLHNRRFTNLNQVKNDRIIDAAPIQQHQDSGHIKPGDVIPGRAQLTLDAF